MKKRLLRTISALLACVVMAGGTGMVQAYAACPDPAGNTTSIIQPRADIVEWKYKIIDGKLYKRLYNYTTNSWVGDWTLVN